ncbi:uncharacterized protein E5676_scaffold75217G00010 [Cucumis melo var. makuwa]|uniref:Uncharacterized protein n=1 Tax=Cucumis melo var. makuwa TaxID=1194695 RepID=A0A5D3D862_CUCMM|nr:uncharacterized protein E6C27_scaffold60G004020 [Cucumis melo var. makuwa]TYK12217.1 uncharacterized protein E5676_scaffold769G00150 [Cucumis melo var. makuwa]TYK19747.1 uncharacterized protein E5676_scaffold75217G00010 [Cucumis melo var. makuwa]
MGNQLLCDHCKKQWHTKEQDWKLHGCPPRGKKRPPNNKQNIERVYVSEFGGSSQPPNLHESQVNPSPTIVGAIMQLGLELGEDDWHCLT